MEVPSRTSSTKAWWQLPVIIALDDDRAERRKPSSIRQRVNNSIDGRASVQDLAFQAPLSRSLSATVDLTDEFEQCCESTFSDSFKQTSQKGPENLADMCSHFSQDSSNQCVRNLSDMQILNEQKSNSANGASASLAGNLTSTNQQQRQQVPSKRKLEKVSSFDQQRQRVTSKRKLKNVSASDEQASKLETGLLAPGRVHKNFRHGLVAKLMERVRFKATVVRFGTTRGGPRRWKKRTILLRDVTACCSQSSNQPPIETDHAWLKVGKQLRNLELRPHDIITFDARVRWYKKAGGCDLLLSHHTRLQKLGVNKLPLFNVSGDTIPEFQKHLSRHSSKAKSHNALAVSITTSVAECKRKAGAPRSQVVCGTGESERCRGAATAATAWASYGGLVSLPLAAEVQVVDRAVPAMVSTAPRALDPPAVLEPSSTGWDPKVYTKQGEPQNDVSLHLPRELLSNKLVTGRILAWKGRFGWIWPDEPLNHQSAGRHAGRIYIRAGDLVNETKLAIGMLVKFRVYSDAKGLGAESCSSLEGSF